MNKNLCADKPTNLEGGDFLIFINIMMQKWIKFLLASGSIWLGLTDYGLTSRPTEVCWSKKFVSLQLRIDERPRLHCLQCELQCERVPKPNSLESQRKLSKDVKRRSTRQGQRLKGKPMLSFVHSSLVMAHPT